MLFKPHVKLERITDITPELLQGMGVTALLLDVDNTMAPHKEANIVPGLINWFLLMKQNNIDVMILSNAKPKRLKKFADSVELPFIAFGLKPLPISYFRAAGKMKQKCRNIAVVGDQIFTDILGGHLSFCKTILLTPIKLESSVGFKMKRFFERKLLKLYKM